MMIVGNVADYREFDPSVGCWLIASAGSVLCRRQLRHRGAIADEEAASGGDEPRDEHGAYKLIFIERNWHTPAAARQPATARPRHNVSAAGFSIAAYDDGLLKIPARRWPSMTSPKLARMMSPRRRRDELGAEIFANR